MQRQLAVTLDQLGIAQRRVQSMTGELEETRGNLEAVSAFMISTHLGCTYFLIPL